MAGTETRRGTMKTALAENLRVLMTRKLFEKITIKQICDETGVIRATFYNYFDDKYDCLSWILHMDFTACEGLLYQYGTGRYFQEILRTMEEEHAFYRAGYSVIGQNSFQEMIISVLADVLNRYLDAKRKEGMLARYGNGLIAAYYAQCVSFVLQRFVMRSGQLTAEEARQMITDLLDHSFQDYIA